MGFWDCSPEPRGYKGPSANIEDNGQYCELNWNRYIENKYTSRTTMSNNRIIYQFFLLSINCDLTKNLQCDEQIKEFAAQKCRKVAS